MAKFWEERDEEQEKKIVNGTETRVLARIFSAFILNMRR